MELKTQVNLEHRSTMMSIRSISAIEGILEQGEMDLVWQAETYSRIISAGKILSIKTKRTLYNRGLEVGSLFAVIEWQELLAIWGKDRQLAQRPTLGSTSMDEISRCPPLIQHFYRTYQRVSNAIIGDNWRFIIHPIRQPSFGLYCAIPPTCLPEHKRGERHRTAAKRYLIESLHPEQAIIEDPSRNALSKIAWDKFGSYLSFGKRWAVLQKNVQFDYQYP